MERADLNLEHTASALNIPTSQLAAAQADQLLTEFEHELADEHHRAG